VRVLVKQRQDLLTVRLLFEGECDTNNMQLFVVMFNGRSCKERLRIFNVLFEVLINTS